MSRPEKGLLLALGVTAVLLLWGDAGAAPEGVAPGAIRAVLAKTGATLRERPIALARTTEALPHGTRLRVMEVRGAWIRVTLVANPRGDGGWIRTGETVEPFALTQAGRGGPVAVRDAQPTDTAISAAGRQFDEATEASYRGAHPDLGRFYPLVDRIETTKPDPEAVRLFLLEGRLGRPQGGE